MHKEAVMILADKIIKLRKKNGWSQEELAEKMNVSRQAVSKWESAQSVPDLGKLLQLAELFGVTTDYLLKDDIEDEEVTTDNDSVVRRVSLEEAVAYLNWRAVAAKRIALAVFMCIFSVIPMLLLGGIATELPTLGLSEDVAGAVGLILLLLIVAGAVAIFIHCGFLNAPYEFLEKEPFETEYGVSGMVKERQKAYKSTYARCNIAGACICVVSPVLLFIGAFSGSELLTVIMLNAMILTVGLAVVLFVLSGVRWASMQRLLKEGDFSTLGKIKTKQQKKKELIGEIYWIVVFAIYLGWSFLSGQWGISWVVWPIAAVLFGAVNAVCNLIFDDKE